jgi:uncharacterized membrane protein
MADTDERPASLPHQERPDRSLKPLGWLLLVAGLIGLVAAVVLLLEKVRLLEDPSYVPSCSLNPVLSCGTVMGTEQAAVLGFPNPVLGVIAFPVVVTTGVALLGQASFPRWYWRGLQAGVLSGLGFVGWLIFQSLYRINALCPYCMVVWAVTIPIAVYVTVHNVRTGLLPLPRRLVIVLTDFAPLTVVLLYLLVAGLAAERFWDYWVTLLP